jgi:2,3-bisphosphoglycerate-independent phosphoglycerate mutase
MDGYGINPSEYGNAIAAANKPNIDKLMVTCPVTYLAASGMEVGLPMGQMGNSEVGHTNIGAGRVVYQDLTRITKSILDGDFFVNPVFKKAIENCKQNNTALHLLGLVSDGGVHSHNTHLYALVEMAKQYGLENVYVHCFMDGRDVSPISGIEFIKELEDKLKEIGIGKIATIMGRYYAMDREKRWDRVEKAYAAMVYGEGEKQKDPVQVFLDSYKKEITDEFIVPTVIENGAVIKENDSVISFNFRSERVREITKTFVDPEFTGFNRKNGLFPLEYVCMTQYDALMPNVSVAYNLQSLGNTFGEYISKLGLKQLRIAESTKYAHVTFFFNGGVEAEYEGEDRVLIPTADVATFDLKPEMSAYEVTDELIKRIESDKYDVIVANFANCDMVGHTGVFEAAVKAVQNVDECVGRVIEAVNKKGGVSIVTADHGNADKMKEADGSPFTAHTTNKVPFIVVGYNCILRAGGMLADIAPTMLDIMELKVPAEMTGISLIKK